MKLMIVLALVFAGNILFADTEDGFCNWGFVAPKRFSCDGKTYIYGSVLCGEIMYNRIFCDEKYTSSGKACSEDNNPATIACYNRMIENPQSVEVRPEPKKSQKCVPDKEHKPFLYKCTNGKAYYSQKAACNTLSGSKVTLFCQKHLFANFTDCQMDAAEETYSCLREYEASQKSVYRSEDFPKIPTKTKGNQ